jgi:hypothetical protein
MLDRSLGESALVDDTEAEAEWTDNQPSGTMHLNSVPSS